MCSGNSRATSRVWVPIEPVLPRTTRLRGIAEQYRRVVAHRTGEEQPIDPIQEASMAGNDGARILDTGLALQHRLDQVAGLHRDAHGKSEREPLPPLESDGAESDETGQRTEDEAARQSLP